MKDLNLVESITAHEREQQAEDALFDRVASGDATAAELEALERRADSDEQLRVRLEASRPLSDEALERITAKVTKSVARAQPVVTKSEKVSGVATSDASKSEATTKPKGTVVSIWKKRAVMFAGPLALAAAMLLYFTAGQGTSAPSIPGYAISATSEKEMRGDSPVATRLKLGATAKDKDARYTIVLTPETAVPTKVVAFAFIMTTPEPTPLEAKIETSPEGAIKISGATKKLEGAKELRVVVGPPASIGRFDDAIARAQKGESNKTVRVMSVAIDRE